MIVDQKRQKIVFVGNAQAHLLNATWISRVPGAFRYTSNFVHYKNIGDAELGIIKNADVIINQISDLLTVDAGKINPYAKLLHFPYVNAAFVWPFSGHTHPRWGVTLMHKHGVFAGESGDGFLARQFNAGASPAVAFKRYIELDIVKSAHIARRYEMALELQRVRDAKAGDQFKIADYIDQNLTQKILFLSRQRPAKPLLWQLARPLFSDLLQFLGDPPDKLDDAECLDHERLFGLLEVPIHPALVDYFQIPGRPPSYRYHINRSRMTFRRYAIDYMTETYQHDIFEGIALVDKKEFSEAVPVLRLGLEKDPDSPYAKAALAKAFFEEGHLSAALEFIAAASLNDCEDVDFLALLAEVYRKSQMVCAAISALERIIELYPFDLSAASTLIELLLFFGRIDRALEISQSQAAQLKHVPSVQLRLSQLQVKGGQHIEAELTLQAALEFNPGEIALCFGLADVLVRLGRADDAVKGLEVLMINNPGKVEIVEQLAHICWRVGRVGRAIEAFTIAQSLTGKSDQYDEYLLKLRALQRASLDLGVASENTI